MQEREKWERRYQQAKGSVFGSEPSLVVRRALPFLPRPGRCLDLAGGEGRNALFLARLGWEVVVADCAVAGLARARRRFAAADLCVRLLAADLESAVLGQPRELFDLLLVVNFHDRSWVVNAHRWLRPGGVLVAQGFAKEQLGRGTGGPSDPTFLWGANELLALATPGLRVLLYEDHLVEEDENPAHRGPKWVVRLVAARSVEG
ncbi:MAG: class I SAM-dependent methyltransferase [Thermoanaerobaculaceae bacterium]|nr:class I SAM-dependent methyltransferase [Thermoanaerobaculaceae bacterium]MDI9623240.1 class I SAM-dependent methyltransferase [Acidobacteriota bacterium]HPW56610.1 class I SAM-dependent methyltransferase [Thermoanaerobaculaceae bacterium]